MLTEYVEDSDLFDSFCIDHDLDDGNTEPEEIDWEGKKDAYRASRFLREGDSRFFSLFLADIIQGDIYELDDVSDSESFCNGFVVSDMIPPRYVTFFKEHQNLRQGLVIAMQQVRDKLQDTKYRTISCVMEEIVLGYYTDILGDYIHDLEMYVYYVIDAAKKSGLFGDQIPDIHEDTKWKKLHKKDFDKYHQKVLDLLETVKIDGCTLETYARACLKELGDYTDEMAQQDRDFEFLMVDKMPHETIQKFMGMTDMSVFALFEEFGNTEPASKDYPVFKTETVIEE